MRRRLLCISSVALTLGLCTASADIVLNLNAQQQGQAAPFGSNPVNVTLGPGTYYVTAIGTAQGGLYDAWSAWSFNLNCLANHTCLQGWETSFDLSYSAGYFGFGNTTKYDTPTEALAHAFPVSFTLTSTETVSFGFNECAGCLGDNRGGLSLNVSTVPEPASVVLLLVPLAFSVFAAVRRRTRR